MAIAPTLTNAETLARAEGFGVAIQGFLMLERTGSGLVQLVDAAIRCDSGDSSDGDSI
jgi:hypothetical protein